MSSIDVLLERPGVPKIDAVHVRRLIGRLRRGRCRRHHHYAASLLDLKRFEEAQSLMRKTIAVARRVLGGNHEFALKLKWCYAQSLYKDDGASLDDLCEAVATLEDVERTARRVFGGSHPLVLEIEPDLQIARAALHARDDACDYDEPD